MTKSEREKARRERLIAAGLCVSCRSHVGPGDFTFCADCRRTKAIKCRNRYRLRKGIPIDAPLAPQGRPALY